MAETDDARAARATTLLRGAETGGRLAIIELQEVRGHEPPRHLHANEDEVVYVLAGTLTIHVGEDARHVTAGSCLFLPRGTEHGYAVESAEARLLVVLAPAGLEGYFDEVNAGHGEVDVERLVAMAARYGVAITGPAPTVARTVPGTVRRSAGLCGRSTERSGTEET